MGRGAVRVVIGCECGWRAEYMSVLVSVWCELHRVAAHSSQQQQYCVLWCVRYTARVVGSEQQQQRQMRRAWSGAYAGRAEWLTLRAVCPGNGLDERRWQQIHHGISRNKVNL